MNNIWMIHHDYINWIENFLVQSLSMEVEQFMASFNKTSNKIAPLMTVDRKGIATIPIMGPMAPKSHAMMQLFGGTSTAELKKSFTRAGNDSKIKGVLMPVNSPGGHNTMLDETADLIHQVSQIKPVLAHTVGSNASAAYYVSSQANKIFAENRTNEIGSIGTRIILSDTSKAAETAGVKKIIIATGKNKAIAQPGTEITQDHQDYIRSFVNELQGFFNEAVVRGRPGLDINAVNDGSVFLANVAKQKGLIDGVNSLAATRTLLDAMIRMR